ncbi:22630_t:CDS:2 [Entrophospora sp. SA101]|nr:22630_t:CDS:2 [Entrophospora sp. SA101]
MLENIKFQFVPLKDLAEIDKDNIVDVIGIVKRSHELVEVTSKQTQKAVSKTLSVALNSILLVNPSIPEARRTKKLVSIGWK